MLAPDPCVLLRRCFCEPIVWRAWGPPAPISRPSSESLMGKRVEIYGTNREDVDGRCGVVTDLLAHDLGLVEIYGTNLDDSPDQLTDPTTWYYTVELDDGEPSRSSTSSMVSTCSEDDSTVK